MPKVVVFDSGAGGLTIARAILHDIGPCELVYFADNGFFPYGLKEDALLTERIIEQVSRIHQQHQPDLVVIACNTASTLALEALRSRFSCPFVGVVPAIKPAARMSTSKVIGVLATPATVARPYTHQLITDFAADTKVILHGSHRLVEVAEGKMLGAAINLEEIFRELEGLFLHQGADTIDTVVLACTHFPILLAEFEEFSQQRLRPIRWVDSREAIARRVMQLLNRSPHAGGTSAQNIRVTFSQPDRIPSGTEAAYTHYLCQNLQQIHPRC